MMTYCRPLDREIDLIDICKMLIGKLLRILLFSAAGAVIYGGWKFAAAFGRPDFSLVSAVKNLIVGAILGFLLGTIVYCVIYLFDGKIKTYRELLSLGIPLYGIIPVSPRKKLSFFAEKLLGGGKLPEPEQEKKKLAAKLETTCRNNGIGQFFVLGDAAAFSDEMEKFFSDFTQVSAVILGDITENPEAVEKLARNKNVLMVITEKATQYTKIDEMVSLCRLQGVNLMGYIAFV